MRTDWLHLVAQFPNADVFEMQRQLQLSSRSGLN
jgi:hypothetical protein